MIRVELSEQYLSNRKLTFRRFGHAEEVERFATPQTLTAFNEFESRGAKHNENAEAFYRDLQSLVDGKTPAEPVKTAASLAKRRTELAHEVSALTEEKAQLKKLLQTEFDAWQANARKAHAESKEQAKAFVMGHYPTDVGLQQKAVATIVQESSKDANWMPSVLSPYFGTVDQHPASALAIAKHQLSFAILKASGCFDMVDWQQSKTV